MYKMVFFFKKENEQLGHFLEINQQLQAVTIKRKIPRVVLSLEFQQRHKFDKSVLAHAARHAWDNLRQIKQNSAKLSWIQL